MEKTALASNLPMLRLTPMVRPFAVLPLAAPSRRSARLRGILPGATALATFALAASASADGAALKADLIEAKSIKLDGVPKEWSALQPLAYAPKGKAGRPDIDAKAAISYDNANLYIAADVADDVLRGGGGDHVQVVIGFPGGVTQEVLLYPGDPGKSPGSAKTRDGAPVSGAKVVEAPRGDGWSLEAIVPWAAFPQSKQVRVGLRGAIFVADVDAGAAVHNVVGTAPSAAYSSLPALSIEPERALFEGLVRDKGIKTAPRYNTIADVAGDSMKERVLVFDRYLVVLGSNFRKGSEYYYSDLGVDPSTGMLPQFEIRDLTGDGQSEIVLRKRVGTPTRFREVLQVLSFGNADVPVTLFQHEVGLTNEIGSVANDVSFLADGAKIAIKITPGTPKGFTASTYRESTETALDPLLAPWGTVASQTYRYGGATFSKTAEERQTAPEPAAQPAQPAAPSGPKPPPPPSAGELVEKIYEGYRRDRGVAGRARFDLTADVTGDKQPERVVVHDRDLVVFGKGFKGGAGYTFISLPQFAAGSDIVDVSTRDVTGDGKADLVVKGLVHVNAPKASGVVDREVVLVFQIAGDALRRVFACEVARSMGKKRVQGSMQFVATGKDAEIELSPGKAIEWDERSYPFNQDYAPIGGIEPLLLPWGGNKPIRYRFTGNGFSSR
jgi:hypothetical protein